MIHRPVASTRSQREFADNFASDFEAVPLHNTVHDMILDDDQLVQLCDAAAEAKNARHSREIAVGEDGTYVENLNEAWGKIAYVARQRALEVVAEACAKVLRDGEQWAEHWHWNAEMIQHAQQEAREWLEAHTNETKRARVGEVLTDG